IPVGLVKTRPTLHDLPCRWASPKGLDPPYTTFHAGGPRKDSTHPTRSSIPVGLVKTRPTLHDLPCRWASPKRLAPADTTFHAGGPRKDSTHPTFLLRRPLPRGSRHFALPVILRVNQDAVLAQQDQVLTAVAVDVGDRHLARLRPR